MPVFPFVLSGATTGSGAIAGFAGLEHETDHSGYGLARMLAQYAATPRLRAFLEILLDGEATIGGGPAAPTGVQAIEDLAWELLTKRFLHVVEGNGPAAGVNLDVIGKLLGLPRSDYSAADAVYILLLKVKIQVNRSNGRLEELLTILELAGITDPIVAYEYYPGVIRTVVTGIDADPAAWAFWDVIRPAKAAGVFWRFVFSTEAEDDVFRYADTDPDVAESSTTHGYGDLASPPTTGGVIGGDLA